MKRMALFPSTPLRERLANGERLVSGVEPPPLKGREARFS
jgi:hypothetical protein